MNYIKKFSPSKLLQWYRTRTNDPLNIYVSKSYSQEGEDMILKRIFGKKTNGFYIDIGALHPKRFSNTHYFYKLGWSGVNIDAMPGSMKLFRHHRKRDINIEAAVGDSDYELIYYMFNEPALNTFDPELAKIRDKSPSVLIDQCVIKNRKLADILYENLPPQKNIDFLSVDVEGMDLEVLKSNDWEIFRPNLVLVECLGMNLEDLRTDDVHRFLKSKGYDAFAKTVATVIFKNILNKGARISL